MKSILIFLATFFTFYLPVSYSQQLDIKWSNQMRYSNKKDGYYKSIIGANENYIYCFFNRKINKKMSWDKHIKLVAFNKQTLEQTAAVALKGFPENKPDKALLRKLSYHKTIIFDKVIYVFWYNETKDKDEIYVQSFNEKLEPITPLKKVWELTSNRSDKKKAEAFVLGTKNDLVLIGGEKAAQKEETVVLSYKLLNSNLEFVAANEVELPVKVASRSDGLTSAYELGEDGKLYIYSYVTMNKSEKKELQKNEISYYCIFSAVNLETAAIKSYRIKFDQKNVYSLKCYHEGDAIKLYGFYSDLNIDPKGNSTQGLFYSQIDKNTFDITDEPKFIAFSNAEKNELKKMENDVSLFSTYITKIQKYNGNDILFCYKTHSYTVTICSSKSCRTNYYCKNSDVLCMSVSKKGEINWLTNYDRYYIYDGWYIEDVQIILENDKFLITYGDRDKFDTRRNMKVPKKRKEIRDYLDYLVLNPENGEVSKKEICINPPGTKRKDRKYVLASDIIEKDNALYASSNLVKVKPVAIAASVALLPLLIVGSYIPFYFPSSYYGIGYIGSINVVK